MALAASNWTTSSTQSPSFTLLAVAVATAARDFFKLSPRVSTSSVIASVSAARRLLKVATRWLKARLHVGKEGRELIYWQGREQNVAQVARSSQKKLKAASIPRTTYEYKI